MMTIKFVSGEQRRVKADTAAVRDGVLILSRSANDRSVLMPSGTFPARLIEWAPLDNGTVIIGDPDSRFKD